MQESKPKPISEKAHRFEIKYHAQCWAQFYLCISEDYKITHLAFRVMGSPTLMAICFWLSEQLPGLKCEQLQGIQAQHFIEIFSLNEVHWGEAALVQQLVEKIYATNASSGG